VTSVRGRRCIGMRPRTVLHTLALATTVLAASASAASADSLVAAAPGARNLTANGGYVVWAAPGDGGRWRLTVRAPNGTVTTPAIADFGAPPAAAIGSDRFAFGDRRLLAVYSRCEGSSSIAGCDVYALDLRAGTEERIPTLSSRTYSETAPSIEHGRLAFVRRGGGPRPGLYSYTLGSSSAPRRLTTRLARETANNGSRVAYSYNSSRGGGVAIRRLSGDPGVLVPVSRQPAVPRSPLLRRYNAAWLLQDGRVQATDRFAGSGGPYELRVRNANRALPATTNSIALYRDQTSAPYYLDAEGVKLASPALF
jgi:hypothetical protein